MQINGYKTRPSRFAKVAGFTLAEVMVAFTVMLMGVSGSMMAITKSYVAIDQARCSTLAAQIMQSQIENLRLANWNYLTELNPVAPRTTPCLLQNNLNIPLLRTDSTHPGLLPDSAADMAQRFTLSQSIAIDPDAGRENMLKIQLTVTWRGHGGVPHTRTFITRYCKEGIYNYYATAR